MARDRKRAKQRRARGGGAAVRRRDAADAAAERTSTHPPAPGTIERADLPGALDHAGAEVDEFDAALVRGAAGVPVAPDADLVGDGGFDFATEDALQEPQGPSGPGGTGGTGGGGGGGGGGGEVARPSGAPLRGGNRAIGFLRASWAELQRVQWPDRRQVTQATAVVLGFVTIAGLYLGLADYVAKEIVEFVL
ncbi:MAG: preprotein translocase subunit SecE [Solirubrobacteraceae bacterium]